MTLIYICSNQIMFGADFLKSPTPHLYYEQWREEQRLPFERVAFEHGLHGEVAEARVLLEVLLGSEFVFEHAGKVSHIFPWSRLHKQSRMS